MPRANNVDNNSVYLVGRVSQTPEYVFHFNGCEIFEGCIDVTRRSGTVDCLPFASEASVIQQIKAGDYVSLDGSMQHRGKVNYPNVKHRLVAYVNTAHVVPPSWQAENHVSLFGHICKAPLLRISPKGARICELLIAVPVGTGRQEYCFCIAWGAFAELSSRLSIGAAVDVEGRFQSREYRKRKDDGTWATNTAHEISLYSISEA